MLKFRFKYFIPLLIGIVALFLPLVRDFHIESAMIAAVIGAFWGGLSAANSGSREKGDARNAMAILGILYLASLPLLINALITGCYTVHGLGLWLLLPAPGVFLGYSIGRLFREFDVPFPKTGTVTLLLLIAAGELAYEFFSLPQLYFFNHVWGWWPGPIYDEVIRLDGSLVGFRFITFCWILVLWLIPDLKKERIYRWIVGLAVVGLFLSYTQLERMGIVTPNKYLQEVLGGFQESEHLRLYYAENYYSEDEIGRLNSEIEFYIHQIKETLQITLPDSANKIECYLYAHPWQKKRLVGAKYTSYVTVWRETPQIHIAREQIDGSMKHEVVHAVTALLEEPGILPNIGLTEGVAVALDPDRSPRSTIDQLVAAQKSYPTEEEMRSALSYWGFYTGRSAVSYTTTGSFVRHLLETYPPENFVKAYEAGSVKEGYAQSFEELVSGWHQRLDSIPVDSSDHRRASEIFGQLSIFEQHCPHKITGAAELFDQYRLMEAEKDTSAIISVLTSLKELSNDDPLPKLLWTVWNLRAGNIDPVIQQASTADTLVDQQLLYSDAFILKNNPQTAKQHLYRAMELAVQKSDTTYGPLFANRMDSLQWSYDLRIRLDDARLEPGSFQKAYYLLKIRSVRNAIKQSEHNLLAEYAQQLLDLPVDMEYFRTYLSMIHHLAYTRFFDEAGKWIEKLSQQELNLRYRERLGEEKEWLLFMRNSG